MTELLAASPIRIVEAGLPGEGMASIARRTGAFGSVPSDSDAQVLDKFADWAIQENPGFKGDKGDPGSAGDGYASRDLLATAGSTATNLDDAGLNEPGFEGRFVFSTADLSAAVASDPDRAFYIAKASDTSGASGAWVRQTSASTTFRQAGVGSVNRTQLNKSGELASVADFGAIGDGIADDTDAIQAAFDAMYPTGIRGIYFPPGTYLISKTIEGPTGLQCGRFYGNSGYDGPAGPINLGLATSLK